jgi:GT2 family glycosyltransferase
MIEDVGGFDPRFFMYYEDLDLAWRARLRGWSFIYTPRSVVHHVHCGTSGEGSPLFLYYVERNRVLVSLKNAPLKLAIRSLAVFCGRAARKCWRAVSHRRAGKMDRLQARAYVAAAGSLFACLPGMFRKRLSIRLLRRKTSDAELVGLFSVPPLRHQRAA